MSTAPLILPVILSGGAGTRLWPLSRPARPKQLLPLVGKETMLQLTARRVMDGMRFTAPIVVANAQHADPIAHQLAAIGVGDATLILEPVARNTAPAIALAAIAAGNADTPLLVMPSDHVIADVAAFHDAIERALPFVRDGWLATFGIAPDAPETGYGWIRSGEALGNDICRVAQFIEKPPRDRAEAMLAAGGHSWNGGIFLFRADAYLAALAAQAPAMLTAAEQAMNAAARDGARIMPDNDAFAASPSDSIDYAVMEKADRVIVAAVAMGWSDVGSWDSFYAIGARDADGNVRQGDVVAIDTQNCLLSGNGVRIAVAGVSDLIVVASGNDVLILPRGQSQSVKALLEAMQR